MVSGTDPANGTANDARHNQWAGVTIPVDQPLRDQLAQAIQPALIAVLREMSQIADEQAAHALEPVSALIWEQVDALIEQVQATMWTELERTVADLRGTLHEHVDSVVEPASGLLRREVDDILRPLTAPATEDNAAEQPSAPPATQASAPSTAELSGNEGAAHKNERARETPPPTSATGSRGAHDTSKHGPQRDSKRTTTAHRSSSSKAHASRAKAEDQVEHASATAPDDDKGDKPASRAGKSGTPSKRTAASRSSTTRHTSAARSRAKRETNHEAKQDSKQDSNRESKQESKQA